MPERMKYDPNDPESVISVQEIMRVLRQEDSDYARRSLLALDMLKTRKYADKSLSKNRKCAEKIVKALLERLTIPVEWHKKMSFTVDEGEITVEVKDVEKTSDFFSDIVKGNRCAASLDISMTIKHHHISGDYNEDDWYVSSLWNLGIDEHESNYEIIDENTYHSLKRAAFDRYFTSAEELYERVNKMCTLDEEGFTKEVRDIAFSDKELPPKFSYSPWKKDNPCDPRKVIINGGLQIQRQIKRRDTATYEHMAWVLITGVNLAGKIDFVKLERPYCFTDATSAEQIIVLERTTKIDDVIEVVQKDIELLAQCCQEERKIKSAYRRMESVGIDRKDPAVKFSHEKASVFHAHYSIAGAGMVIVETKKDGTISLQFVAHNIAQIEVKELVLKMQDAIKSISAFNKLEEL